MKINQIKTQTGVLLFSMLFIVSLLLGSCIVLEPVPVRRPIVIKVEDHDDDHKHGHKHGHEKHEKHEKYEKKKEHKEEEEDDSIHLN